MIDILQHQIYQAIAEQGGIISFAEFMQKALYTPNHGYYTSPTCPFGLAGDFVTAPLISPLFSQCLASQIAEVLPHLKQPILLECGAGSGEMAVEILLTLEKLNQMPEAYWILELGAGLKLKQYQILQNRCPHLLSRVKWLDRIPSDAFEGIIMGNEVIDALPIVLFEWHVDQVWERGVGLSDDHRLIWKNKPADNVLIQAVQELQRQYGPWPEGFISEISMIQKSWLGALSECLKRGLMLWIDYGGSGQERYHANRGSSLRTYQDHRNTFSPLENVGQQDITFDVDFTALALAGLDLGLECAGYTLQAFFLMNCGIMEYVKALIEQYPEQILKIQSGMRQLTHPAEMGERFKVLALTKNYQKPLRGFRINNRKISL